MNTRRRGSGRRMRGGVSDEVKQVIDSKDIGSPTIINPESNFVVVTYWWGRGNVNKNISNVCRDEVLEYLNTDIAIEEEPGFRELHAQFKQLRQAVRRGETPAEWQDVKKRHNDTLSRRYNDPAVKLKIKDREASKREEMIEEGEMDPEKKYEQMIDAWKRNMEHMKCNYMVVEYPIEQRQYQAAINGKPYFIKKCLDVCGGRGVLYIDGDMQIDQYPKIFDIKGVDFMARGWNMDPRANSAYLDRPTDVCFDPWRFETSGGTMFFADTPRAKSLLDVWSAESAKPVHLGKADDRILSMIFTEQRFATTLNVIQLPVEYLWLNRDYNVYQENGPHAYLKDSFISHPACLTSEDSARDQGASSNRDPDNYYEAYIDEQCIDGGVFYYYITLNGNESLIPSMEPYVNYLKSAKNSNGQPAYRVIGFAEKYGEFNSVAEQNLAQADQLKSTYAGQTDIAILPASATIPEILARLKNGQDVTVGGKPCRPIDDQVECILTRIPPQARTFPMDLKNVSMRGKPIPEIDIRELIIDLEAPMYFSAQSPIVIHLLAMCTSLSDLNKHVKDSYLFHSRIRWQLSEDRPPQQGARRKTHKRKTNSKRRMYKKW